MRDGGTPEGNSESEGGAALDLQVRLLPRACPELNAMDHLFRFVKGRALADQPTRSIDDSALGACRYLYDMSRRKRLTKAGEVPREVGRVTGREPPSAGY